MNRSEQIDYALERSTHAARIAERSMLEAIGAETIGANDRAKSARNLQARFQEDAAIWTAAARKLILEREAE